MLDIIVRFYNSGVPATWLTPTLTATNLWDYSTILSAVTMTEIANWFYKYTRNEYNSQTAYAFSADWWVTLPVADRYWHDINELDAYQNKWVRWLQSRGWIDVTYLVNAVNQKMEDFYKDNELRKEIKERLDEMEDIIKNKEGINIDELTKKIEDIEGTIEMVEDAVIAKMESSHKERNTADKAKHKEIMEMIQEVKVKLWSVDESVWEVYECVEEVKESHEEMMENMGSKIDTIEWETKGRRLSKEWEKAEKVMEELEIDEIFEEIDEEEKSDLLSQLEDE